MSTHFVTSTGTYYQIKTHYGDGGNLDYVRRLNDYLDTDRSAEGEWVRLYSKSAVIEGYPILLETAIPHTTTPVLNVWEEEDVEVWAI